MQGKRYLLTIACSQYSEDSGLENLKYPENDANELARVLSDEALGGFEIFDQLINQTHFDIERRISDLLLEASKDDFCMIYFSGHGKVDRTGHLYLTANNSSEKNIVSTAIPIQNIKRFIDNSYSKKIALILDCCFSGRAGKGFKSSDTDTLSSALEHGRGQYVLAATSATQTAREYEYPDVEGKGHGAFTYSIINGIKSGAADLNQDGHISITELYDYLSKTVPEISPQNPTKWEYNVEGASLIVAFNPKVLIDNKKKSLLDVSKSMYSNDSIDFDTFMEWRDCITNYHLEADKNIVTNFQLLEKFEKKDLTVSQVIKNWKKTHKEINSSLLLYISEMYTVFETAFDMVANFSIKKELHDEQEIMTLDIEGHEEQLNALYVHFEQLSEKILQAISQKGLAALYVVAMNILSEMESYILMRRQGANITEELWKDLYQRELQALYSKLTEICLDK